MRKLYIYILFCLSILSYSNENNNDHPLKNIIDKKPISIPLIPLEPAIKKKGNDIKDGEKRELEKTFSIYLDAQMNVFIPLEVTTDIDIEATILGDEVVTAPFEINLNKKPEKSNYYTIKYSDILFDIDEDGQYDTRIYSPKYINDRKETNNFVEINGSKISKEGKSNKRVYITVEVGGE